MRTAISLLALFSFLLFLGCQEDEMPPPDDPQDDLVLDFTPGKNSYMIEVEGTNRNFHVQVPPQYDASQEVPIVVIFHGSGGNGNQMYQQSGWAEKADAEGFLAVFPTALSYYVTTIGGQQTKWSAGGLSNELEPGTEVIDDIPFVEAILDRLEATFEVDTDRIYAAGFSNGGGFTKSRVMIELDHRFAAIGASGGPGLPIQYDPLHGDYLSLYTIMGNQDDKVLAKAGQMNAFPMEASNIMAHPYLRGELEGILATLQLDSTYTATEELPHFNTLRFTSSLSGHSNEFRFRIVKDMGHINPNGQNHPSGLSAPAVFWPFFLEHPRP